MQTLAQRFEDNRARNEERKRKREEQQRQQQQQQQQQQEEEEDDDDEGSFLHEVQSVDSDDEERRLDNNEWLGTWGQKKSIAEMDPSKITEFVKSVAPGLVRELRRFMHINTAHREEIPATLAIVATRTFTLEEETNDIIISLPRRKGLHKKSMDVVQPIITALKWADNAANRVLANLFRSFAILHAKPNKTPRDKNECQSALSAFSQEFSDLEELNRILEIVHNHVKQTPVRLNQPAPVGMGDFQPITKWTLQVANHHARQYFAGAPMPPELPPIRRVFGMQDSTAAALRFFASLIEQRASGTTRLITSVGVSLQMPHQVLKAPSIRAACLLYEEYCRNEAKQHALRNDPDEPPPPPPLSRGHVQYLLDLLVGSRRRQLAGAVDGIFCETVIDQSRNIKHLIGLVTEGRPKYGGKLLLLLRDVEEEYQRKEACQHTNESSQCVQHSIAYALDLPLLDQDDTDERVRPPPDILESLYCPRCALSALLIANLQEAVRTMPPLHQHHPETKDTLLEYIDKLALYYDQFAYHNMEKKLEQKTFDRILEEMKPYVDVLFLYDYKMGVKPMSAEESQQKYYGKSSESWFGCAVIWRNADGTYHLQFFDVFARNGGAQGGFMTASFLECIIEEVKEMVWSASKDSLAFESVDDVTLCISLLSDGAGALAKLPLLAMIGVLATKCHVTFHVQAISIAGDGKDLADAHFAIAFVLLCALVASYRGERDIYHPSQLAAAVAELNIQNSTTLLVTLKPEMELQYNQTLSALEGSHSRLFHFNADGELERIDLKRFNHPDLPTPAKSIVTAADIIACIKGDQALPASTGAVYTVVSDTNRTDVYNEAPFPLTSSQKKSLAYAREAHRHSRDLVRQEAVAERKENLVYYSSFSPLHHCSTSGCVFLSASVKVMAKHERKGRHLFVRTRGGKMQYIKRYGTSHFYVWRHLCNHNNCLFSTTLKYKMEQHIRNGQHGPDMHGPLPEEEEEEVPLDDDENASDFEGLEQDSDDSGEHELPTPVQSDSDDDDDDHHHHQASSLKRRKQGSQHGSQSSESDNVSGITRPSPGKTAIQAASSSAAFSSSSQLLPVRRVTRSIRELGNRAAIAAKKVVGAATNALKSMSLPNSSSQRGISEAGALDGAESDDHQSNNNSNNNNNNNNSNNNNDHHHHRHYLHASSRSPRSASEDSGARMDDDDGTKHVVRASPLVLHCGGGGGGDGGDDDDDDDDDEGDSSYDMEDDDSDDDDSAGGWTNIPASELASLAKSFDTADLEALQEKERKAQFVTVRSKVYRNEYVPPTQVKENAKDILMKMAVDSTSTTTGPGHIHSADVSDAGLLKVKNVPPIPLISSAKEGGVFQMIGEVIGNFVGLPPPPPITVPALSLIRPFLLKPGWLLKPFKQPSNVYTSKQKGFALECKSIGASDGQDRNTISGDYAYRLMLLAGTKEGFALEPELVSMAINDPTDDVPEGLPLFAMKDLVKAGTLKTLMGQTDLAKACQQLEVDEALEEDPYMVVESIDKMSKNKPKVMLELARRRMDFNGKVSELMDRLRDAQPAYPELPDNATLLTQSNTKPINQMSKEEIQTELAVRQVVFRFDSKKDVIRAKLIEYPPYNQPANNHIQGGGAS